MRVQDVMTKPAAFCGLDATLAEAAGIMGKRGCGFLPVIGEGGNVIGVITDRDICIALGTRNQNSSEVFVRDVVLPKDRMVPRLYTCAPEESAHCVLKTMRESGVRRLPVVDREGVLQGVLSIDDLVRYARDHWDKAGVTSEEIVETCKAVHPEKPHPVAA